MFCKRIFVKLNNTAVVFFAEEGVSPGVQLAFASMLGETTELPSSEDEEEEEDSLSYVDDEDDKDYVAVEVGKAEEMEEKPTRGGRSRGRRKKQKREEEEAEDVSVGDVFALEMELNRENKKMMKVRRRSRRLPV